MKTIKTYYLLTIYLDICSLPKKIGPCRGGTPRFYFDSVTKRCTGFSWGGCRPNGNNFKTEKECMQKCGKTQGISNY